MPDDVQREIEDQIRKYQEEQNLGNTFADYVRNGMWTNVDNHVLRPLEMEAQRLFEAMNPTDVGQVAKVQAYLKLLRGINGRVREIITTGQDAALQLLQLDSSTPEQGGGNT